MLLDILSLTKLSYCYPIKHLRTFIELHSIGYLLAHIASLWNYEDDDNSVSNLLVQRQLLHLAPVLFPDISGIQLELLYGQVYSLIILQ